MSKVRVNIRHNETPGRPVVVVIKRKLSDLLTVARGKLNMGNKKISHIWNGDDGTNITEEDLQNIPDDTQIIFSTNKTATFPGNHHAEPKKLKKQVEEEQNQTKNDSMDMGDENSQEEDNIDEQFDTQQRPTYLCVECEEQAILHCNQCEDYYCNICYHTIHMHGTRKKHTTRDLYVDIKVSTSVPKLLRCTTTRTDIAERAKYIPVRLTLAERRALRFLQGSIKANAYTDRVDVNTFKTPAARTFAQSRSLCAVLTGLIVGQDYELGQKVIENGNFQDNEKFFQHVFEIGRRHKIMNPDKMRNEYGPLMYMLMDAELPETRDMLGFSCVRPIKMVYNFLEKCGASELLCDELIVQATEEIIGNSRTVLSVKQQIKKKEKTIEYLAEKYSNDKIDAEMIKQCMYSITDNNAFLRESRDCCDQMIELLREMFHPDKVIDGYSLAIYAGSDGHRLTHDHGKQYHYVLQSLALWREILHNMFMLWYLCDADLLDTGAQPYELKDTGQGLHRVQACPRVGKAMRVILHNIQKIVGDQNWVGSSVVHLGDHNVPNALMFIDKYGQVSRILAPIISTLRHIPELMEDKHIAKMINQTYGSEMNLKREILCDFFKSGFDGSGASNFYDAGSCIDGRLTSAWNWCSKIAQKRYHPIFLLTGFTSFDGEWQS
jgi:hypothetical protein